MQNGLGFPRRFAVTQVVDLTSKSRQHKRRIAAQQLVEQKVRGAQVVPKRARARAVDQQIKRSPGSRQSVRQAETEVLQILFGGLLALKGFYQTGYELVITRQAEFSDFIKRQRRTT